ncbi:MAG: PilX N-terminal domain-containing pilus assembly protein, partial [Gammaproteobacteria bacterium]
MRARDIKGIRQGSLQRRQRGVLTTFTAIVVLVLLTLMMVLAVRAGVFEQRDSANDARQKLAFHVAESGIEQAKEYIRVNSMLVGSYTVDLLPDGTDGWLAAGSPKWLKCSDAGLDLVNGRGSHPCFGESVVSRRADIYYFSDNGSTNLPLATNSLLPTGNSEQVAVQALLCVVQEGFSDSPTTVEPCTVDPDLASGDEWMITFLARGESDCTFGACNAEALIADRATHGGAFAGGRGPDVPLVTKSSFPP